MGIDHRSLFIGGGDWEGEGGSSIATEDKDSADLEAGEYAHNFLEVVLSRLWLGRFGRRTTTLCVGGESGDSSTPAAAATNGRRDCRRPTTLQCGTGQGRQRQRNGGYIGDDNDNDYIRQRDDAKNHIT